MHFGISGDSLALVFQSRSNPEKVMRREQVTSPPMVHKTALARQPRYTGCREEIESVSESETRSSSAKLHVQGKAATSEGPMTSTHGPWPSTIFKFLRA